MAFKFEVFNPDTSSQFDGSKRLGRLLGSVQSGLAEGAISVPDFAQGAGWVMPAHGGNAIYGPWPVVSGTTLSWSFQAPAGQRVDTLLLYGVY